MKINILGRRWTIYVLSADSFTRKFEGNAAGITIPQLKEIVINEEDLNVQTVAHELWHGAMDGLCVAAADLSSNQLEEVACELFAHHGSELMSLAKKLTKELKK